MTYILTYATRPIQNISPPPPHTHTHTEREGLTQLESAGSAKIGLRQSEYRKVFK